LAATMLYPRDIYTSVSNNRINGAGLMVSNAPLLD